ncbi:hypothetical protein MELB17_00365 [Marinobacter sp. ELB17]|nr:hypothetical protein MELB17_00365 [Marinobacter sp. ELB17]
MIVNFKNYQTSPPKMAKNLYLKRFFYQTLMSADNICTRLGIRHPQVRGLLTVVSTDLLIDLFSGKQLAIAV